LLHRFVSASRFAVAGIFVELVKRFRTWREAVHGQARVDGAEFTRAELYAQARRLGVMGRSSMSKDELAEAVRTGEQSRWQQVASQVGLMTRASLVLAPLRRPTLARALLLPLTVVAAGALGLLVAIEIAPRENLDAQALLTGQPIGLETVTSPGGETTVALVRTKEGKTGLAPVRVIRTITGPGRGEPLTSVRQLSETEVVTSVEPVTVVVTKPQEVTVTETVVLEVTTTVQSGKTTKTKP
jgi:hypothetical protein